jgi:NAD(P)-dependent dehydrogenase (short-subunit alcohol dehydrogenase family)
MGRVTFTDAGRVPAVFDRLVEWDKVVDFNLKSIFLCAKAAIPTFQRQRSGRIAEVMDMVGWVLFLATRDAGYLTGQTLSVNGGRLMV